MEIIYFVEKISAFVRIYLIYEEVHIISFIPKFLESEVSNLEDPAAVYEAVAGLEAAVELEH